LNLPNNATTQALMAIGAKNTVSELGSQIPIQIIAHFQAKMTPNTRLEIILIAEVNTAIIREIEDFKAYCGMPELVDWKRSILISEKQLAFIKLLPGQKNPHITPDRIGVIESTEFRNIDEIQSEHAVVAKAVNFEALTETKIRVAIHAAWYRRFRNSSSPNLLNIRIWVKGKLVFINLTNAHAASLLLGLEQIDMDGDCLTLTESFNNTSKLWLGPFPPIFKMNLTSVEGLLDQAGVRYRNVDMVIGSNGKPRHFCYVKFNNEDDTLQAYLNTGLLSIKSCRASVEFAFPSTGKGK